MPASSAANGAGKTTLLATLSGGDRAGRRPAAADDPRSPAVQADANWRAVVRAAEAASLAFDLDVRTVVGMGGYPYRSGVPRDLAS